MLLTIGSGMFDFSVNCGKTERTGYPKNWLEVGLTTLKDAKEILLQLKK